MSFTGFMFAFMLALLTFYVNQRIAKMTNIKILINTLFDIYGGEQAFDDFDSKEVATRLMNEIINIEKMNDNNFYVNLELETLKELRLVYYRFTDKEIAKEQINSLCFNRLTRSFIILAFLDIIHQTLDN
jgi:hypothetical protein